MKPLYILGLFMVLSSTANAQSSSIAIASALQPYLDDHTIAGAVTLVADEQHTLSLTTVGLADIAAKKPMQADNLFWIASMTKPITATAVMMLQEEGKLSVDDPVAKYCPELANLKTPSGKPAQLTLRHLLTHTSGMAEPTAQEARSSRTLAELIPHFADKPLLFEPGERWQYCQSAINTLGRIVEVVSGQSLPDFMQKRLFDPLGMKDTTFYPSGAQCARLAKSYTATDGRLEESPLRLLAVRDLSVHDHYPAANGGLFSTAADYGRFCQMILNRGAFEGKHYLKPETVALMTSVQTGRLVTGFTPGNGWGLGWCVIRKPQGVSADLSPGTHGHGGAYGTQAWIDPVKKRIYLLLVQRTNFPNSDASAVRQAFQHAAAQ